MARKRMIDPEFFLDEGLAKLSPHARLLYIGSWTLADDTVFTLPFRPDWIKAQVFPYEKIKIEKIIGELVETKHFVIFENGGGKYIYIRNMSKYQRIEKPSKQKYPAFDDSRVVVGEESGNTPAEVKLREVKLREVNIYVDF